MCQFTSKSGLHCLLWKSESSSKLRTGSLRRWDVQFCLQKKTQRICKMKLKDDNIDKKNTATIKEVWYEEIACRVSQQTLATHNRLRSVCSGRSMTPWNGQQTTCQRKKTKSYISTNIQTQCSSFWEVTVWSKLALQVIHPRPARTSALGRKLLSCIINL